jgi:hypothetical protein
MVFMHFDSLQFNFTILLLATGFIVFNSLSYKDIWT